MRGLDQQASVTVKRPMSNTFHLAPIRFLNRPLGSSFLIVTQSYVLLLLSLVTSWLCRLTCDCVDFNSRIKDKGIMESNSKIFIFWNFAIFFFLPVMIFGKYKNWKLRTGKLWKCSFFSQIFIIISDKRILEILVDAKFYKKFNFTKIN